MSTRAKHINGRMGQHQCEIILIVVPPNLIELGYWNGLATFHDNVPMDLQENFFIEKPVEIFNETDTKIGEVYIKDYTVSHFGINGTKTTIGFIGTGEPKL